MNIKIKILITITSFILGCVSVEGNVSLDINYSNMKFNNKSSIDIGLHSFIPKGAHREEDLAFSEIGIQIEVKRRNVNGVIMERQSYYMDENHAHKLTQFTFLDEGFKARNFSIEKNNNDWKITIYDIFDNRVITEKNISTAELKKFIEGVKKLLKTKDKISKDWNNFIRAYVSTL